MPTGEELIEARDKWTADEWERHFTTHQVKSAGLARYGTPAKNNVTKSILIQIDGSQCWYGGPRCKSKAFHLDELEIDHVIAQKCDSATLLEAVHRSSFQVEYFDVHDPGNLALICTPCNRHKQQKFSFEPIYVDYAKKFEARRDKVITKVASWYRKAKLDEAMLKALQGLDMSDDKTWDIAAELIAHFIDARTNRRHPSHEASVESSNFIFTIAPSPEWCEDYIEELDFESRRDERMN